MTDNDALGKVLVIDDNEAVLKSTSAVLKRGGYNVITTTNIICSDLIFNEQPDLILLDVKLPGLKGDQAGKIFQEVPGLLKHGIIVLHSNLDEDELSALVTESGVAGFIKKTPDPSQLKEEVRKWIEVARKQTSEG